MIEKEEENYVIGLTGGDDSSPSAYAYVSQMLYIFSGASLVPSVQLFSFHSRAHQGRRTRSKTSWKRRSQKCLKP